MNHLQGSHPSSQCCVLGAVFHQLYKDDTKKKKIQIMPTLYNVINGKNTNCHNHPALSAKEEVVSQKWELPSQITGITINYIIWISEYQQVNWQKIDILFSFYL